jgi:uncharacterized C2H2 Zn-finger protein
MSFNNFPENWERDAEIVEILECDTIPTRLEIGTKYHCSWAKSKGMVWRLMRINGTQAILQTPRTNKILYTETKFLRHINKAARNQAKQRLKKEKRENEKKN